MTSTIHAISRPFAAGVAIAALLVLAGCPESRDTDVTPSAAATATPAAIEQPRDEPTPVPDTASAATPSEAAMPDKPPHDRNNAPASGNNKRTPSSARERLERGARPPSPLDPALPPDERNPGSSISIPQRAAPGSQVNGRAPAGSTVEVDGRQIAVGADGRFSFAMPTADANVRVKRPAPDSRPPMTLRVRVGDR